MKIFSTCFLCVLCLHHALGYEEHQYKKEAEPKFLQQCKGIRCGGRRGFFNEKFKQYKYFSSRYPTTIVLHIKGVQHPNLKEYASFYICKSSSCDFVKLTSQDQIFVYKNVNQVRFVNLNPALPYHVNYYIGCEVVEKQNTVVEHVNPFISNGKCWILIPRIYEDAKNQYVASTFAMIKNVKVPKGASLNLYDMLSDRPIWNLMRNTTQEATMVESNQDHALYKRNRLTTVMYFEIHNCHNCIDSEFNLELSGLSSHDYSCFKEKQACEHHIGDNYTNYNCEDSKYKKCSAFDQISYKLTGEKPVVQADESRARMAEPKKFSTRYRRQCWRIFKGREHQFFCGYSVNCSRYRFCSLDCFLYKMNGRCNESPRTWSSIMV